jgi:biopolymer transport protein ExbD
MMRFSIRNEGSPQYVEGVEATAILEGVRDGIWEMTDEVRGPGESNWQSLELHPVFAKAMAEFEPPPAKPHDDETRLDMNPLIDVALVLLIFFMLTTTYEELRKELIPASGSSLEKQGKATTDKQLQSFTIRVTAKVEGEKTVIRVENEVVDARELQKKFEDWMTRTGHTKLAMEISPDVEWETVVRIQDAAAGAKITETIRIVRPPRE